MRKSQFFQDLHNFFYFEDYYRHVGLVYLDVEHAYIVCLFCMFILLVLIC